MTQETGSSLGRVWQGKLLQEHSDPSATAVISSSLPCLLRRQPNAMIHRVHAPLLQSHHTRRLLAALPAPETDSSQHLRTSKVSLLYLAHINCLLSNNALPVGNGSSGRRFFLANSLYYSAFINYVYSANLTSLLFLFRPQPVREDEGKFCQRD